MDHGGTSAATAAAICSICAASRPVLAAVATAVAEAAITRSSCAGSSTAWPVRCFAAATNGMSASRSAVAASSALTGEAAGGPAIEEPCVESIGEVTAIGPHPDRGDVLGERTDLLHVGDAFGPARGFERVRQRGVGLAPTRMTISTVGVVPGILRLAEEKRAFNLAVSLHSADAEERAALVPASRRWPLAELIAACREYGAKTGRRIFFEWTLIAGANDSPAHAAQVAALLAGIYAHVNLIPLNPTNGFTGTASASAAAREFQRVLRERGLPSTVRQRRGIDVAAGCGQLRASKARATQLSS